MAVATYGAGLYGTDVYGVLAVPPTPMISVREKPPLRTTTELCTPSGRRFRWASDEPDPANVPSGTRHSDTMPGGFEQYGSTLPRKPGVDYADLERLSKVTVKGAAGETIGEFRLDSAPRTSGDQMAVSPAAVGYQACLEDNKFARMVYVDRDVGRWGDMPVDRKIAVSATSDIASLSTSNEGGGLVCAFPNQALGANVQAEAWYSAPAGLTLSQFGYRGATTSLPASWRTRFATDDNDAGPSPAVYTPLLDDTIRYEVLSPLERHLFFIVDSNGSAATPAAGANVRITALAVYGDHGLTTRDISGDLDGLYASDVVAHAVQTWAPTLTTMIQQSSFVIPHLVFADPTTAGEIVRQASRFDLPDWAVWEDQTFWWTERGAQARRWRARIGPSELEETGPQVERLWESIVVQYADVDGSTRTVGPPDSGADTESDDLKDSDPENPANKLGLTRRDLLAMGTSTAAGATEVGRRFLLESRLLDRSGKARAVGFIEDDRGVLHPYHAPRAGDEITFVDASDKSARRIIRTEKDHDSRTVTFDLDAPPEGLSSLLERLGVVLVPLGVGS